MPSGLPGLGKPRLIDAGGGLWLVAGDAPLPQYSEAALADGLRDLEWVSKCAIAHEAVVEYWLAAPATLPMKLFTMFESDERALAYIRTERRTLDRIIRRVAGKHEWGVRIRLVEPAPEQRARPAASGTGYLAAKKHARDAAKRELARGHTRANAAFAALAKQASEAERHVPPAGASVPSRLLLDAAFLVTATKRTKFQTLARRLTRELKSHGYRLELTGPWPPYNFIER
jgi:hypothetical protein